MRLKMTMNSYSELIESRDWCARNGYEAMKRWYDEELEFQTRRRALPIGVQAMEDPGEDRRQGRRWER